MSDMLLEGRSAIVTGGGRGIGEAIARNWQAPAPLSSLQIQEELLTEAEKMQLSLRQ